LAQVGEDAAVVSRSLVRSLKSLADEDHPGIGRIGEGGAIKADKCHRKFCTPGRDWMMSDRALDDGIGALKRGPRRQLEPR
jgi:hypothetical protein